MWLLSSYRAELHHFIDHTSVEGGYAILSHTWGLSEQTYQDLRDIGETCRETGENPRDFVSEKIRQSCILAEEHGYRWIWVDSCCIDKSSSSELSEAINSMFTWYADSEVCFAYLDDVPSDCDFEAPDSPFHTARWHTRGWTLQELIAPALVVFVSKEWNLLGTKTDFAALLAEITWIQPTVLTNELPCSDICVSQRMRWASRRKTTRVEDEAYCLMGLFDVHMPTIYGEGRLAFQRLQEEIMKQLTDDTSLLASNYNHSSIFYTDPSYTVIPPKELNSLAVNRDTGLFATSPAGFLSNVHYSPCFSEEYRLQPYPSWPQAGASQNVTDSEPVIGGATQHYQLPRMTRTAYGIDCRLPTFEVDGIIVAVLLCEDYDSDSHIGILLHPVMSDRIEQQARNLYRVGGGFTLPGDSNIHYRRIVRLGNDYYNIRLGGKPDPMKVTWRDICIESGHISTVSQRSAKLHRLFKGVGGPDSEAPFRHPRWLLEQFSALGLELYCWRNTTTLVDDKNHHLVTTVLLYESVELGENIRVTLGTRQTSSPEAAATAQCDSQRTPHWATLTTDHRRDRGVSWTRSWADVSHDCSRDHISDWPNMTREFGDAERTVRLSFTHSSLVPATLIMHAELDGHVYQRLSQKMGAPLPSFKSILRQGVSLRDPQGEDADQPKGDLGRFVKWPEYVRLQRQKVIFSQRLAHWQFPHTQLDKRTTTQLFKLLRKYRSETKQEKKAHDIDAATAEQEAQAKGSDKSLFVKYGLYHTVALVEAKKASLVVIAHDVDPIELVVLLPALCRKMSVPCVTVKGKARLGTAVHKKSAAILAIQDVRSEDQHELATLVSDAKAKFTDKYEEQRRQWGGGTRGAKFTQKAPQACQGCRSNSLGRQHIHTGRGAPGNVDHCTSPQPQPRPGSPSTHLVGQTT